MAPFQKTPPRSVIQLVNPINKIEEREKFLFDQEYNPQFTYPGKISQDQIEKFGEVSDHYVAQATTILDKVIEEYGTETAYLDEVEGRVLSREETSKIVRTYLEENKLENVIKINFSAAHVSSASMYEYTLNIRYPITQREKRIKGMLHHEIGTHFFRRLNEERQPWYKNRSGYHFTPYLETEEGLAVVHSHMDLEKTSLWFPALYYILVQKASKSSFAELNTFLKKYVDSKERRFNMCMRVKRGMEDTSLPGGLSKDQVYFRGVMKVAKWMKKNHFDSRPLYQGKIGTDDLEKATHANPGYVPILPNFLSEDFVAYQAKVKALLKQLDTIPS